MSGENHTYYNEGLFDIARRQARQGLILASIGYVLLFIVGIGVLLYMGRAIIDAQSQLSHVSEQLKAEQTKLATARAQEAAAVNAKVAAEKALTESQTELAKLRGAIFNFKPFIVPLDAEEQKESYTIVGPKWFKVLEQAIEDNNRKLPFDGANSPSVGFTSPGYAAWVLKKEGFDKALAELPRRAGPPQNGDIITYPGGYTMFYFKMPRKEFVIGMTQIGVVALNPKFSQPSSILEALPR